MHGQRRVRGGQQFRGLAGPGVAVAFARGASIREHAAEKGCAKDQPGLKGVVEGFNEWNSKAPMLWRDFMEMYPDIRGANPQLGA